MAKAKILVVDDEPDIRELVQDILEDEGYSVSTAENGATAREQLNQFQPNLVLLDIWMPDIDGVSLLKEWSAHGDPGFPIIMMSGHGTVETAVEATRLGACDFIEKPIALAKLLLTVSRAIEANQSSQSANLQKSTGDNSSIYQIIGKSSAITYLREQADRLSKHDTWALIYGEAGSGRESLARYIHQQSSRAASPFVACSVSSISEENMDAALFGYQQDEQSYPGLLEKATMGTLLLDDIADLSFDMQKKLFAALERKQFLPLNGRHPIRVDVRVMAASRHDLEEKVKQQLFSEELFFLLNVVPVRIPALRDRKEDIPDLINHFSSQISTDSGLPYREFSLAAKNRLRNHMWPGNIRELKNTIKRLLILGQGNIINMDEVEESLTVEHIQQQQFGAYNYNLPLREARDKFERDYLIYHLKAVDNSVGKLAEIAGMERTHLYRKLKNLNIDPKNPELADES